MRQSNATLSAEIREYELQEAYLRKQVHTMRSDSFLKYYLICWLVGWWASVQCEERRSLYLSVQSQRDGCGLSPRSRDDVRWVPTRWLKQVYCTSPSPYAVMNNLRTFAHSGSLAYDCLLTESRSRPLGWTWTPAQIWST